MLLREQPNTPWTQMDYAILEAYQMLQDEICPQCGQPIWLCRSTSNNIEWTAQTEICYASRRREEAEWNDHNDKKATAKDRKNWGKVTYVLPRVIASAPEGTELPTRTEYYEGLSK